MDIIKHFDNRVSQRERMALSTYDIYKNEPNLNKVVKQVLPETYGENRYLIPDKTFVLIGYYKSDAQLEWISNNLYYNFRLNNDSSFKT